MAGVADKKRIVHNSGEGGADERPGPENPVVLPGEAHQSWPERYRRVHRGAGEGAADENVGSHDETDCNWSNGSDLALVRVDGGGVNRVHQPECHHDLEY